MEEPRSREYGLSDGVVLAQSLAKAGVYIFRTEDAVRLAPQLAPERIRYLLKVLAASGWIVRLRRDLYAGTGRLPGGVDVPPFVVATSLVSPAVISHLSALSFHGLTDQLPFVVTASTPRKVVTPSMRLPSGGAEGRHLWRVQGIDYRYVTVVPSRFELGQETIWLDERFRVGITDRERTVLDLFAMPRVFGGVSEGLMTLEQYWEELDISKLVQYAIAYDSVAVVKRLGWALQWIGVDSKVLMPLLEVPSSYYSPIDPGRARRGEYDKRWKVVVNLTEDVIHGPGAVYPLT